MLAVASCLRLRMILPDVIRPYKVNLFLPTLFIVACIGILVYQLWDKLLHSGIGFGLVFSGWVAGLYFESRKKIAEDSNVELSDVKNTVPGA